MSMPIPTRDEINVFDSLDERSACKHFLGKTVEEAEALFRENSIYYQEAQMWMGPVAFRYYVQAAIHYIKSPEAAGDSDIVSCLASTLEFRLKGEASEFVPIAQLLSSACAYILKNLDRFEVEKQIYGDLQSRYRNLERSFQKKA
jgi:hypothetical protein